MAHRLDDYKIIKNILEKNKSLRCMKNFELIDYIKNIDVKSEYGDIFIVKLKKENKLISFKFIAPNSKADKLLIENMRIELFKIKSKNGLFNREIFCSELCSNAVLKNICVNFPLNFHSEVCSTEGKKQLVIVNEYAPYGDFKRFIETMYFTREMWVSFFAQVFNAINFLHKNEIQHSDLHWGNILVIKDEDKTPYKDYVIEGKRIRTLNTGYTFLVYDFGLAKSKKHFGDTVVDYKEDYNHIIHYPYMVKKYQGKANNNFSYTSKPPKSIENFCVRINTLIETGYFDENTDTIGKEIIRLFYEFIVNERDKRV